MNRRYISRVSAEKMALDIAQKLGIDTDGLTGLTLSFIVGDVPLVTVSRIIPHVEDGALEEVLQAYRVTVEEV